MRSAIARGTLYLMGAQLTITVSGYLIHLILARLFGPATYGDFGIILSLILITKTLFLTGTNRAISKFIAEDNQKAGAILRSGLYLQLAIIALNTAIYLVFADAIAALFKDPGLANPIRLSSLVVIPLGLDIIYAKGYLNGLKLFKQQAYLEALHSFLKVAFAVLLVALGFGLYGAIGGYILAPLVVVLVTLAVFKPKLSAESFDIMKLVRFALPITLFYTMITLTMDSSLLLVKRILIDDALTGFYTAASTIAKITFSVFTALPFILLPSIASAIAEKDDARLKTYINQSLRYSMMVLFPIAAITSVYAEPIIRLFYSDAFAQAATALPLLTWGFTFYSFIMIFSSFMSGANKPQHAMALSAFLLVLAGITNYLLIPQKGLAGAALATLITAGTGMVSAGIYTWYKFRTLMSALSFARITGTTAVICLIGLLLPASGLKAIMYAIILGLAYVLILLFIREIKKQDIAMILPAYGKGDQEQIT